MKKLLLAIVVTLSGCAVIFPKQHDPVMFDQLVTIQVQVAKVNCSDRNWGTLLDNVHHLKIYTELRKDPQAPAVAQLEEALLKADNAKNDKFCEAILKLNQTRIEVIEQAWEGR